MNKPEAALKHFGLAFLLAVVFYVLVYWAIEAFRPAKGPWAITFISKTSQPPCLVLNQHRLGLTNVQILFPGTVAPTNQPQSVTIQFNEPKPTPFPLPFGNCIFLDTTFLPGTVTLRAFGHEIELLPRVLIIDHREHLWKSGEMISLPAKPRN